MITARASSHPPHMNAASEYELSLSFGYLLQGFHLALFGGIQWMTYTLVSLALRFVMFITFKILYCNLNFISAEFLRQNNVVCDATFKENSKTANDILVPKM